MGCRPAASAEERLSAHKDVTYPRAAMRLPRLALCTAFGSALAGALLSFNAARPAEPLTVPSMFSTPPTASEAGLLFGAIDDQLPPLPKLAPPASRPAAAQTKQIPRLPALGDEGEIWLVQQP